MLRVPGGRPRSSASERDTMMSLDWWSRYESPTRATDNANSVCSRCSSSSFTRARSSPVSEGFPDTSGNYVPSGMAWGRRHGTASRRIPYPPVMKTRHATRLILAGVLPALLLGGCSIDVREEEQGDKKRVDIRTPVGGMRVNTNVDMPATGLAVYPGARPLQDGEPRSADVDISASVFGVRVLAAKFTSDDAPGDIVD